MTMHLSDDAARGERFVSKEGDFDVYKTLEEAREAQRDAQRVCKLEEVGRLPGLIRLRCEACDYAAFLIPSMYEAENRRLLREAALIHQKGGDAP